jgi:hypothetical protein
MASELTELIRHLFIQRRYVEVLASEELRDRYHANLGEVLDDITD